MDRQQTPVRIRNKRRKLCEELSLADDELLREAAGLLPDVDDEKEQDERE